MVLTSDDISYNILICMLFLMEVRQMADRLKAEKWLEVLTFVAVIFFIAGLIYLVIDWQIASCMLLSAIFCQLFGFIIWCFESSKVLYKSLPIKWHNTKGDDLRLLLYLWNRHIDSFIGQWCVNGCSAWPDLL